MIKNSPPEVKIRALESSSSLDHFGIYADILIIAYGQSKAVEENLNLLDPRIHQWAKSKGAVIPPEKRNYYKYADIGIVTIIRYV